MRSHRLSQEEINSRKFLRMYERTQGTKLFSEIYTSVGSCKITYCRKALDLAYPRQDEEPKVYNVKLNDDKSYITIDCINPDCTEGYFNISDILRQMISNKQTHQSGTLTCTGYQDAERIDQYHCLSTLEYSIEIVFK